MELHHMNDDRQALAKQESQAGNKSNFSTFASWKGQRDGKDVIPKLSTFFFLATRYLFSIRITISWQDVGSCAQLQFSFDLWTKWRPRLSHTHTCIMYGHLKCDTVWTDRLMPTFQGHIQPPSARLNPYKFRLHTPPKRCHNPVSHNRSTQMW